VQCVVGDTTDEDRESICCAVRYTVTLPRAVRRTIGLRSPHSVRVLIATTDAGRHRSPVLRRQQSVQSVSSTTQCSNASADQCLLLAASCIFWRPSRLYIMLQTPFPLFYLLVFPYTRITPVIKVIFWFQSCLLIISRFPHRPTAE